MSRGRAKKPHQNVIAGEIEMLDTQYCWTTLTMNETRKCKQKFDTFKPPNSDMISKYELQRMLREMGKDLPEEELIQKIWEADPKGQGFISYEAFLNKIESEKARKYNEVTKFIGLTFDSVLEQQKIKSKETSIEEITWQFLKSYLSENFQMDVNIHTLAGKKCLSKSLNRNEFMNIFS